MKTNSVTIIIIVILVLAGLGYGFYTTLPSSDDVSARYAQLLPSNEAKPINTTILDQDIVKNILTLKTFGQHPLTVDPNSLNRRNPFEGL